MIDYFHTDGCRMRFIANLLDDPWADDCGICDNCTGTAPEPRAPGRARRRGRTLPAPPADHHPTRKQAVDAETGKQQAIPADEQAEEGRGALPTSATADGDSSSGRAARPTAVFDDRNSSTRSSS